MCEIHRYTTVHSDGRREKTRSRKFCSVGERFGQLCDNTKEFKHPTNERRAGATTAYYAMPPSPPSSDSSFPVSGNEAERTRKRRSAVYVNGTQVIDLGRKQSQREKHTNDHVVIVDPPSASTSPSRRVITPILKTTTMPTYHYDARPVQYPSLTRPEVKIEVNDTRSGHRRQTSHSSHNSHDSGSVSEEERRLRKLKRELVKAEETVRLQKMQSEIDRANEAIASRPAVPSAPNPLGRPYRRPSVSVRRPDHELADAIHQLRVTENTIADAETERRRRLRRAEERRKAEEAEAQKLRLKERMNPASQRRQTKVMFSDGTYRYEY